MARIWHSILAALAVGLLLVACGSGSDGSGESAGNGAAEPARQDRAADDGAAAVEQAEADNGSGGDLAGDRTQGETERQVITNASVRVEVAEPREAVQDVLSRVSAYSGHVEQRRERTDDDGDPATSHLTVRVPAESLPELLEDLEELGEVTEVTETARDVTDAVRDLDARIEALETSVDRLLEIMDSADSTDELLQAETTLSQHQADLESLVAERDGLTDQVEMSTLELQLASRASADVQAEGFLGGLQSGWNALVIAANALLVAAGAALPWLLVLAVPVVVVVVVFRIHRKRRKRATPAEDGQSDRPPQPAGDSSPGAQ